RVGAVDGPDPQLVVVLGCHVARRPVTLRQRQLQAFDRFVVPDLRDFWREGLLSANEDDGEERTAEYDCRVSYVVISHEAQAEPAQGTMGGGQYKGWWSPRERESMPCVGRQFVLSLPESQTPPIRTFC